MAAPLAEETAESYFLKYAWPCTFIIRLRGKVDAATFSLLEKSALEGRPVERAVLERVYHKAMARMREVARKMGKNDVWDKEIVREYFVNRHNGMIAEDEAYQEAPASLREMCKTVKAKIADARPGFFVVVVEGKPRTVSDIFVPDARIGDSVIVHYGYAIEKA